MGQTVVPLDDVSLRVGPEAEPGTNPPHRHRQGGVRVGAGALGPQSLPARCTRGPGPVARGGRRVPGACAVGSRPVDPSGTTAVACHSGRPVRRSRGPLRGPLDRGHGGRHPNWHGRPTPPYSPKGPRTPCISCRPSAITRFRSTFAWRLGAGRYNPRSHLMWLVRTLSCGSHHLTGHDLGRVGEQ